MTNKLKHGLSMVVLAAFLMMATSSDSLLDLIPEFAPILTMGPKPPCNECEEIESKDYTVRLFFSADDAETGESVDNATIGWNIIKRTAAPKWNEENTKCECAFEWSREIDSAPAGFLRQTHIRSFFSVDNSGDLIWVEAQAKADGYSRSLQTAKVELENNTDLNVYVRLKMLKNENQ